MNVITFALFGLTIVALLTVRRQWAPLIIFGGSCYLNLPEVKIQIGGFNFPGFRLLLAFSAIRVLVRGEFFIGRGNVLDRLVLWLSGWIFIASFAHESAAGSGPQFALGTIYNFAGIYFLMRCWCRDSEEVTTTMQLIGLLLMPIALEMLQEKLGGRNLFSLLGNVDTAVGIRNGSLRARGPFSHPILAGSVGAACFPLAVACWARGTRYAAVGLAATLIMVISSASSGPIMSLVFAIGALYLWKFRQLPRLLRRLSVVAYVVLAVVRTSSPPYFLLARIDLAGGSTGWYRARLIQSSIEHLNEWWLFGTDVTSHWMATGVSERSADIANYYLEMGVLAGLPATIMLLLLVWRSFQAVGNICSRPATSMGSVNSFQVWCLGASLFSLATTAISVSFDGQAGLFFWTVIVLIGVMLNSATLGDHLAVDLPAETTSYPELQASEA